MATLARESYLRPHFQRSIYKFDDHSTLLGRAVAWFAKWPRIGVELDDFLECGPFKPLDALYLCYHGLCILP